MTITLRIIKEPSNRDGWIGRSIPHNRIAFFHNLSSHILDLLPGQIWDAEIIEQRNTIDIVNLITKH